MKKIIFFVLIISCFNTYCQVIKGVIKDSKTGKSIAFVNLKVPNSRKGTSTDIDGKFVLQLPDNYKGVIQISHVSYQYLEVKASEFSIESNQLLLTPKITNLLEVVFVAGENPANDIVRKAVANRKRHNPRLYDSYQYTSYSKEIVRLDDYTQRADSIYKLINLSKSLGLKDNDSTRQSIDSLAKTHHFFITESVTAKKYIRPGVANEKLLAIKTSGIRSLFFATTGTDYQPLGVYDEVITIFSKPYTNPIAPGTLRKYEFFIEDTTFYQQDTVFVMSFRPKKGKKFESLYGQISISKNGYAIRNIIANTMDKNAKTKIKIQQLSQCYNGVWFPTQLNTDIVLSSLDIFGRNIKLEGKSYFSDIVIGEQLSRKGFSDVCWELSSVDQATSEQVLAKVRPQTLDSLEATTYQALDTALVGLEKTIKFFEYVLAQRFPIGKFDLHLNKFFKYNRYEGIRLGVGIYTNDQLSNVFQIGGYVGYGFGDKAWKYGGSMQLVLADRTSTFLNFSYKKDLVEFGMSSREYTPTFFRLEQLRLMKGYFFDLEESYKIAFNTRIAPFSYAKLSVEKKSITPKYSYRYSPDNDQVPFGNSFNVTEVAVATKYAKGEEYLKLNGHKFIFRHSTPLLMLRYSKGISDLLDGDFDYHRVDFTFNLEKRSRWGHTKLFVNAGIVDGKVPISNLIVSRGNSGAFYVLYYFQTMGLYEFVSDRTTSFFASHNFGNLLLNKKFTKPELFLYHNMAIGSLSNPNYHQLIDFKTLENGYFESGIGLHNLIRININNVAYVGLGADLFYRYGKNRFTKTSDNLVVRFNIGFDF